MTRFSTRDVVFFFTLLNHNDPQTRATNKLPRNHSGLGLIPLRFRLSRSLLICVLYVNVVRVKRSTNTKRNYCNTRVAWLYINICWRSLIFISILIESSDVPSRGVRRAMCIGSHWTLASYIWRITIDCSSKLYIQNKKKTVMCRFVGRFVMVRLRPKVNRSCFLKNIYWK